VDRLLKVTDRQASVRKVRQVEGGERVLIGRILPGGVTRKKEGPRISSEKGGKSLTKKGRI